MRSIDPCPKCAGAKPCRGRKPEQGFAEAEPPKGGEAVTVCYAKCHPTPRYLINSVLFMSIIFCDYFLCYKGLNSLYNFMARFN